MSVIFTCSTDDGHPSDLKMADLLAKNNLNGTFYIPITNCEGFDVLSRENIRNIGERFEIGSHTYDHCYLKNVCISESYHQIVNGKKKLEDLLGKEVSGFCYPGGKYNPKHVAIVKQVGFNYARTTQNLCFSAGKNPYEMPTTIQFYPHAHGIYLQNYLKSGNWVNRYTGLKLLLKHNHWIDRIYVLFDYACMAGLPFHIWGHSREIDMLDAWRELDHFFSYVASKVAFQNRITNAELSSKVFYQSQ